MTLHFETRNLHRESWCVFCWPSTAGMQSKLRSNFFSLRLPWRKLNYHLQVVINWRKLLGEGWGHVSTSFSFLTPSHEDLCRLYACCLGLYKFISASILLIYRLLFLWCAAAPLALALFPPSVLQVSTSPKG